MKAMKKLSNLAVTLVFILAMVSTARAQIINIDARSNNILNPVTVFFEAGTHELVPVGVLDGGAYNAYSIGAGPYGNRTWSWKWHYCISSSELGIICVNRGVHPPSETEMDALATAVSFSFTLTSAANVNFYVHDGPNGWEYSGDNIKGLSLEVVSADCQPPTTTHQFEDAPTPDSRYLILSLTATDNISGVAHTYVLRDGVLQPEEPRHLIILGEHQRIEYWSVDNAGNEEALHVISIQESDQRETLRENYHFESFGCANASPFSRYCLDLQIHYFKVSSETDEVVFLDSVKANTFDYGAPTRNNAIVAFQVLRGDVPLKTETGYWVWDQTWDNLGIVDWTGTGNNYKVGVQLRSKTCSEDFFCWACLIHGQIPIPLIMVPAGWVLDVYCSDRRFDVQVPSGRFFLLRMSDRLMSLSELKTHSFGIESETTEASVDVSWAGSDLDLILYDPNEREINPEVASTDPNIEFSEGDTYEQYTVSNPVAGTWKMEIKAMDVPENGEEYTATVRKWEVAGDLDLDGIPDERDAFPEDPSEWQDSDGDSVGDLRDNCPNNPNPEQGDEDKDGIGDVCDNCPDEDSTGFDADGDGCIDSVDGLTDLIETLVEEGVIDEQMENSLLSKISNASKSADKENICAAVNQLEALINQVNAQRDKKISEDSANQVTAYAQSVIDWYLDQLPEGESC